MTFHKSETTQNPLVTITIALGFILMLVVDTYGNEVVVTVEEAFEVEYTGGNVVFDIDGCDINRGHKKKHKHEYVRWSTNVQPWNLYVERGDWEQTDGDGDWNPPDDYLALQIRYHDLPEPDYHNVTTSPSVWFSGVSTGLGEVGHIDWKVVEIGWDDDPGPPPLGTYECTVIFSIESQ